MSVAAVVITLSRPAFVRQCLLHLQAQSSPLAETLVVDASPDDETRLIVRDEFPDVRYLHNPLGPGTMATSRNMALKLLKSDIVAFVDDDAYARPDWAAEISKPYADSKVGAVGGRALNGQPDEAVTGVNEIGKFLADGTLTGNFAADPGRVIEVDHLLGANMSYRRSVLVELGGIRDFYPGTCLREDTDVAFRVKAAGYRLLFTPFAVVEHVAAPYVRGKRFDLRYNYYARRNHVILLSRTVGKQSPQYRNYRRLVTNEVVSGIKNSLLSLGDIPDRGFAVASRHAAGEAARAAVGAAGLARGLQEESRAAAWLRSRRR